MVSLRRAISISDKEIAEAKLRILGRYDGPRLASDYGSQLFMHGLTDDVRDLRRERLIGMTKDSLGKAASQLMDDLEKGQTSQVIFGASSDDLQYFIARGWKIERFVEGLSLKQERYVHALSDQQTVGNSAVRVANELGTAEVYNK